MKALFVTGTDTGVGKTFVGCALATALRTRGLRVAVMKPVETGVSGEWRLPPGSPPYEPHVASSSSDCRPGGAAEAAHIASPSIATS